MATHARGMAGAEVKAIIPPAFAGLFQPYRHKGFYGGRGSAKSHSMAEVLAIRTSSEPLRVLCARQFQNSIADSVKELIEQKIKKNGLSPWFKVTNNEITCKLTDSRFTFIGLDRNPDSVKSLEGADICWTEEAQTVNQKSMDILIPTVRKPGSELWWSWNPASPKDPIDVLLRGPHPPPRSLVKRVSYLDNPWFWQTELPGEMKALRKRDPLKHAHIWLGEYRKLADAQVFKNWRIGRVPVPENARPRFGLDFGFANDPNAAVKYYLLDGGKTLYIAAEKVAANVPITALPTWLKTIPEIERYRITADSSRPEIIDHLNSNGLTVSKSIKGANSVSEGVVWIQGRDVVIDPGCPWAAKEFETYAYQIDKVTNAVLPVLDDGNDHIIDAVRYAAEEDRRGGLVIR